MDVLGYTESGAIRVIFDGDDGESVVPDDLGNRHRQMIAEWEAEGNTIPPYVPPPEKLQPLTARQLRLGLIGAGFQLSQVEAEINGITNETDRAVAKIEWEYASQFERDHHLINLVGANLGLSSEQIDQLWKQAGGL